MSFARRRRKYDDAPTAPGTTQKIFSERGCRGGVDWRALHIRSKRT